MALSFIPLDNPVDSLAKSTEFIDVKPPSGARIDELSQVELGQLKAAAYRVFQHVTLDNGLYRFNVENASELNISEDLFILYKSALQDTNHYADSMREVGQEIQLPPVNEKYLQGLLK